MTNETFNWDEEDPKSHKNKIGFSLLPLWAKWLIAVAAAGVAALIGFGLANAATQEEPTSWATKPWGTSYAPVSAAPTVPTPETSPPLTDKMGGEMNTELEYIEGTDLKKNGRAEHSYSNIFNSCSENSCIVSKVADFCQFRFNPADHNRCEKALYDACERNIDRYDGECAHTADPVPETTTTTSTAAPTTTSAAMTCSELEREFRLHGNSLIDKDNDGLVDHDAPALGFIIWDKPNAYAFTPEFELDTDESLCKREVTNTGSGITRLFLCSNEEYFAIASGTPWECIAQVRGLNVSPSAASSDETSSASSYAEFTIEQTD